MVKFRTKYNCVINDGEHYEPGSSLCQPGRSESLQHIVQRLTRKPNPTMRELYAIAVETGQAFEDPATLSDADLEDRLERVVAQGDNLDAAEALLDAQADLAQSELLARTGAHSVSESETGKKAKRNLKSSETQTDERTPVSGFATEAQKPIGG